MLPSAPPTMSDPVVCLLQESIEKMSIEEEEEEEERSMEAFFPFLSFSFHTSSLTLRSPDSDKVSLEGRQ